MFKHRLAITPDGTIEATAPNPNSPRVPFRVVIERRAPGNVIESNVAEGTDTFRQLVRAAREHVNCAAVPAPGETRSAGSAGR